MDHSSGDRRLAGVEPADGPPSFVSHSRELEDVSFGAIVDTDAESRILWSTPDGVEIVGRGVGARFSARGPDRFDQIRTRTQRTFDALEHTGPTIARPRAFGGFAFHEEHVPETLWNGFDAASFVIPETLVVRSDEGTWLTTLGEDSARAQERLESWSQRLAELPSMKPTAASPGIASTERPTSRADWATQVETALERIDRGSLRKVVLAQSLSVDLENPIDVPGTLERLRREYPNCYRFLGGYEGGGTFFGAPPERLVSKRGNQVETEALAGSVQRGDSPEADRAFADRMAESEKVQHEHELVVDAIRSQLTPLTRTLAVEEQTIRRLANIQHLQTPITGVLEDDRHVLDLVEALHPTPAVGGVPPGSAFETIRDAETFDRGWYAAPIGWFDGAGDGEFAVGIRSGLAREDTVTLFAGNGIVADSDPTDEWEEVQLKFRPILDELR
ncbi:isochorismate synthase [Natronorubrum sediminis]|uniref:isochorismate synthase n=1 Tax=Natronorubrum sediminis TaxID=640943 RepID=A0A1H6FJ20_9EURY|nr:isochorismate synthase [Natronorubrum sediminis]SEH10836.1 isochorismate synthase [Natronorubrum sediminis]